jgi:hypothetical protein
MFSCADALATVKKANTHRRTGIDFSNRTSKSISLSLVYSYIIEKMGKAPFSRKTAGSKK